jgi:hypothetical protein
MSSQKKERRYHTQGRGITREGITRPEFLWQRPCPTNADTLDPKTKSVYNECQGSRRYMCHCRVDRSISHPAIQDCSKVQQSRATRVRDHKLPFGTCKVFSVTPSATLIKIDFKFSDLQIKFTCTIKRGALPVFAICVAEQG